MGERPENHNKPWTTEDIMLVAAYAPSWYNARILSEQLGRSWHAIQYLWCKLYMKTTTLKYLAENDTSKSEQYKKILEVRRKMQLCIGK